MNTHLAYHGLDLPDSKKPGKEGESSLGSSPMPHEQLISTLHAILKSWTPRPKVTIPFFVESIQDWDQLQMVRCIYFTLTADEPVHVSVMTVTKLQIAPFLLVALQGIVYRPSVSKMFFDSPNTISRFFKKVQSSGLEVESDHIWLPMSLFAKIEKKPESGQVYRCGRELFKQALQHPGDTKIDSFDFLEYSEKETKAFIEWEKQLLKESEALQFKFADNRRPVKQG